MARLEFGKRPIIARQYRHAWLVLLSTLPLGLQSYRNNPRIGLFTWDPSSKMGMNSRTYHYAAELARAGDPFYGVTPSESFEWAVYLYPPITVLGYYPFTVVDWTTAYAVVTVLSVIAAVAATAVIVDYIEAFGVPLGWVDVGLILAAFVLSTHAFGTIYYGNINLFLALSLAVGLWALERNRDSVAGIAFGLPALYKVFPALIGLWLVQTRRWRAVGVAFVTGVGGLLGGALLYGLDTTAYYFTDVLLGRAGSEQFVGGHPVEGSYYLTIQQPLSHWLYYVWPSAPYTVLAAVSVGVGVVTLAFFYRSIETHTDRLMTIFVTFVVMIVIFPALRWYIVLLYPPFIGLLYVWEGGPGRRLFVAGGILTSLTYRTGEVVNMLDWLPSPLYDIWYNIAGFAVPPVYGLGLMVAACAWYRYRHPVDGDLPTENGYQMIGD